MYTVNEHPQSFHIICQSRVLHWAVFVTDWQDYWHRDTDSFWRGCRSHFTAGTRKISNGLNASKVTFKWYVTTSLRIASHEREILKGTVTRARGYNSTNSFVMPTLDKSLKIHNYHHPSRVRPWWTLLGLSLKSLNITQGISKDIQRRTVLESCSSVRKFLSLHVGPICNL